MNNTDNQTINPYAPPNSTPPSCELRKVENHLAPLWIWLAVAIVASFLGTPADPVSMYIALAYGLLAFIVGCVLASRLHISVRVIALTFWLVPGVLIGLGGVWFSWDVYRSKRIEVLESFLARHRIYATSWFFDGYESRARHNLRQAIDALK